MALVDVKERPRTSGPVVPEVTSSRVEGAEEIPARLVRRFFVLAFAIGWFLGVLLVVFSEQIESVFGEIGYTNPAFILIVWSPAMAATYLVWRHAGVEGLKRFFKRTTLWRMSPAWWALLIVGIPAIVYTGALFAGTAGDSEISPWYSVLGALGLTLAIGPIEEFGWRGLALPLLQRRHTPLVASLILGSLWGLWHAPAWLFSGTKQAGWSFPIFAIGVLALSVIVTPMFNASKGSILVPMLFHFQVNGPIWPDAEPWDTVVYALVAIAVVFVNRETMLSPRDAATQVLAGERTKVEVPS